MNSLLEKLKNLKSKKFIQDVFTLQVGSIFSTGLSFVVSVVLARVLGAGLYGAYALIFAFTAFLGMFTDLGAHYATITLMAKNYARADKKGILDVLTYFVKITLIVDLTVGLIFIIFSPYISEAIYHNFEIGKLGRFVLLAATVRVFFSLLIIVLQVMRKIRMLTVTENVNKVIYSLLPISFVLIGWGLLGVVLGHFFTACLFLVFSIIFYSRLQKSNELLPTLPEIFKNFKHISLWPYFKFGFGIAVDKNLANLYHTLPILILGFFVVSGELAQFKIASSFVLIPLTLISPISRLLLVQLPKSKVYGHDYLKKHYFQVTFFSPLLMVFLLVPFLAVAPFLVRFFYGSEFLLSIQLIYLFSLQAVINSFGVGFGPIYRTINKVQYGIIVNVSTLIIGTVAGIWLIKNFGVWGGVWLVILYSAISTMLNLWFILRYFKRLGKVSGLA